MEPMCKSVFFAVVMHRLNKLTASAAVLPKTEHHFLHFLNIFYIDSGAIVPTPHALCLEQVRAIPRLKLLLPLPTNPDALCGDFDGGAISGTIRWRPLPAETLKPLKASAGRTYRWHGISKTSQVILFAHSCRLYRSLSHVTIHGRRAEPVCMRLLSSHTPYILADGLD